MIGVRPVYWCLIFTTVMTAFIYSLTVLLSIVPYRCLWLEEYYWINDTGSVSLYPVLLFTFLLLGWWNLCIPIAHRWSGRHPSKVEYSAATANAVLLAAVALTLWALWDWVALDNYRKYGVLPRGPQFSRYLPGSAETTPFEPECLAQTDLEGIWEVAAAFDAPFPRIEKLTLWRNRRFEAVSLEGSVIERGRWQLLWPYRDDLLLQGDRGFHRWALQYVRTSASRRLMLDLVDFEPVPLYDRSAEPLATSMELERVEHPYNSAPRQFGARVVSPTSASWRVGERQYQPNPDAAFR